MTVIMGAPTLSWDELRAAVQYLGGSTLFEEDMGAALWEAGIAYGIDPLTMFAQAWNETGGGDFAGKITAAWRNTCGLKVRDTAAVLAALPVDPSKPKPTNEHPLCHAMFPSWQAGAEAHAQHLRAYCQVHVRGLIVDPRYFLVYGKGGAPVVHLDDLSGRWAPNPPPGSPLPPYGQRLESMVDRLRAAAGR